MSSNQDENRIAGAITFPTRDSGNVQPQPVQPRQPRNLQGLLRFAMEATKAEDAPGNSTLGPMDEERKKFLEEALRSLTVNVTEVLQQCIKVLTDTARIHAIRAGDQLPTDIQNAFDQIQEFIDDIDIANDYYKIGGFAVFAVCFGAEHEAVRALAAHTLAELCQNNPFCQARALECGLVNILINLLESETGNTLKKCVYALSCTTRDFEPGTEELVSQGCGSLLRALGDDEEPTRVKAAFFLRHLVSVTAARAQLLEAGVIEACIRQIAEVPNDSIEVYLSILAVFLDEDRSLAPRCQGLAPALKRCLADDERDLEEKELARRVLNKLDVEAESADR